MSEVDLQSVKNRFGIIGNSEVMDRALAVALRVAPTNLSVLVTGESGVGKEFFPQIIHSYSARKHNKYIAVNCGAIPEGTIDSELFGHEKGSFTGAVEARKGFFEEADKQFVRDYLETLDWNKQAPGPVLPEEVVSKTAAKYIEAYEVLTGKKWNF